MQFCQSPKTVKEIIKHFNNFSRGTISYHLKKLSEESILFREKKEGEYPTYRCPFITNMNDPCYFCDEKKNIHNHHIIPKNKGGSDELDNILRLCKPCHMKLHGKQEAFLHLSDGFYLMRDSKTKEILKYPSMRHIHNLRDPPTNSIKNAVKNHGFKIGKKVDKNG